MEMRKKSLLIGINYLESSHQLNGCHRDVENIAEFLSYRGYSSDPQSQVILRDDLGGMYYPTIGFTGADFDFFQAAIDWLVSEPGTCNFFHYSGHGGQVRDPTGQRPSGILDTICPVDFEERGQIDSDTLHQHLVSRMPPNSTLFAILDCCHSGSALELPYVYKTDDEGNVSLIDNIREGVHLMSEASDLLRGGFSFDKLAEARDLYAGATSFFRSFKHMGEEQQQAGLGEDEDSAMYQQEHKMVTMFSGCRDDQTSADANIGGVNEGAMSWAFLQVMRRFPNPSFLQVRLAVAGESSKPRL
ncbi:metacaspase [Cordyceps javanica]|uniref:Metacaspase n=1 Tax=Cordyceps javanica TaxID=43265 RepID=A0A545VFP0_9HYPO|nr:metacaspase [Cordyceps javanica]TQW11730.1 caspase domain-containing protein [Cordyceps javanica]